MQLGVDAAGVPYRKTITMVAEHPWQNSVDHCSNEGQQCNKREGKSGDRAGGVSVSRWRCRGGGETDAARQGTEEYKLPH